MYKGFTWAVLLLISQLSVAQVAYDQGLDNVLYRLYLDPLAEVDSDLTAMADKGNRSAALLLAQRWSRSSDFSQVNASIAWYIKAFDAGRGDTAALVGLAQLGNRVPYYHQQVENILRDSKRLYADELSPKTVRDTLDVYLMYPALYSDNEVMRLLELHKRGCTERCYLDTYRAKSLMAKGETEAALALYQKAMESDPRAVAMLVSYWGESGRDQLVDIAVTNVDRIGDYSVASVEALALEISNTNSAQDAAILRWLNAAIEGGSYSSLVAKAEYMMDRPQTYDYPPVLAIIDVVREENPSDALYLASQARLVYQWRILNPALAEQELNQLAATKPVQAQFAKAQLYATGGLDEPDPERALEIYQQLILQRNIQAFYRISNLYNGAPAVVRDKSRAFGYASVASELGDIRASYLLGRLEEELNAAERADALTLRDELMHRLERSL